MLDLVRKARSADADIKQVQIERTAKAAPNDRFNIRM
jgi:hypothetical protein